MTTVITHVKEESTPAIRTLILVEIRKLVTVRSTRAVLASFFAAGLLIAVVATLVSGSEEGSLLTGTAPAMLLATALPLVSALAVASEWSTRNGLYTFWLVGDRTRVLTAKLVGVFLLSIVLVACVLLAGLLAMTAWAQINGFSLNRDGFGSAIALLSASTILGVIFGFAWGAVTCSPAASIVIILGVPLVLDSVLAIFAGGVKDWIATETAITALSGQWELLPKALVPLALWYALPLAIGWRIQTRREVR